MSPRTLSRTSLIYPYFAHYRRPVLQALARRANRYVALSGTTSDVDSLPILANLDDWRFGMEWRSVKNIWLGRIALWQTGVMRAALSREFSTLIFFGDMRYLSTWFAAILGRLSGKRVLMWGHGFVRSQLTLQELIRTIFYSLASGHLLYGHRARDIMIGRGFDSQSLYVIYNSLDTSAQTEHRKTLTSDRLKQVRAEHFPDPNLPLVVTIGRLVERKQISLLLYAAAELAMTEMPINILVVGDGPDRTRLEAIAGELKLRERIRFLGAIYEEADIAPLLASADLCVVPGTIGLTCMHAFSYGTPVITHSDFDRQNPEVEAIIEGRTGAFFRAGSANDLARVIRRWLQTGPQRSVVRRDCIAMIERFYNPEKQAELIDLAVNKIPATDVKDASQPLRLNFAEATSEA